MKDRAIEIVDFLNHSGWENARHIPLQADFSTRRFARLERDGGMPNRAILMDADPDQKTAQFVAIARLLQAAEISAPLIYAANAAQGLVLMEDFGDGNFGRMLDSGADAKALYRRGADVLIHLHRTCDPAAAPDLPVFDAELFAAQAELFLDAYFIYAKGRTVTAEETESFRAVWCMVLAPIDQGPRTLMLRDFMPDNLMDIPDRTEWRATGVLDFQDSGRGPAAYDLASLCEAVRRDGGPAMLDDLIDYYHATAGTGLTKNELRSHCRVLAAQRHTRILGIVARLALRTGRDDKLAYSDRIWATLEQLLQDETLEPVRKWLDEHVPSSERRLKT